jgi:hypothetical protein
MDAGNQAAAGDEQERALLVSAEAAMYAKSDAVLWFERVAHDVAVARHAMRIGAVVGNPPLRDPALRRFARPNLQFRGNRATSATRSPAGSAK